MNQIASFSGTCKIVGLPRAVPILEPRGKITVHKFDAVLADLGVRRFMRPRGDLEAINDPWTTHILVVYDHSYVCERFEIMFIPFGDKGQP
jgi:hypothetical protein